MSEHNKDVVREYYARVINGRDLDAVSEFFADERMVECKGRMLPLLRGVPGHARRTRGLDRGGRSRLPPLDPHRNARRRVQGHPAHGPPRRDRVRRVFRIADGKFAGYWCLTNVAGLMRQLTEEPAVVVNA